MPLEPTPSRSDEELIAAIAAGQNGALAELITRHQGSVFRLASVITGDPVAAEDVLQDTFLAAMRSAASYRAGGTVRAWLFSIARHAAWRVGRSAARMRPADEAKLEQLGRAAGWGEDYEDAESAAAALEARVALRAAFDSLSPDDREVLVLRDLEGLGNDEAARVLGIDVPAAKSRIHRARLRLQAACRAKEDRS